MADAASATPQWVGVSEVQFARLVRHGRKQDRLSLDEVIDVVRTAPAVEGIRFDDSVTIDVNE